MTLTLREEVLKNSGLLTEEILEEGLFKKALTIAATIAMIAGVAIGGIKAGKSIKQYNSVKNVPVAVRYEKVNNELQNDIKNKEYELSPYTVQKLRYVSDFRAEYNDRNNQAIIYINIPNDALAFPSLVKSDLTHLVDDYLGYISKQSSKIEDKISPDKFNKTPLKVVVTREVEKDDRYSDIDRGIDTVNEIIKNKLGTMAIDWEIKHID